MAFKKYGREVYEKYLGFSRLLYIVLELLVFYGVCPSMNGIIAAFLFFLCAINIAYIIFYSYVNKTCYITKEAFIFLGINILMIVSTWINTGNILSIKYDAIQQMTWLGLLFMCLPYSSKNSIQNEMSLLAFSYVIMTFIFNGIGACEYLIDGMNNGIRLSSYGLHPNELGTCAYISIMLSVYLLESENFKKNKICLSLNIFAIISEIIVLTLTESRSSSVALAISLVFMIFYDFFRFHDRKWKFGKKILVILEIILTVYSLCISVKISGNRYIQFSDSNEIISAETDAETSAETSTETSTETSAGDVSVYLSKFETTINNISSRRYELVKGTLIIAIQSPIIGNGHATLSNRATKMFGKGSLISMFNSCHNLFVQVFYEVGVIGLALLIWLLLCIFKKAYVVLSDRKKYNLSIQFIILLGLLFIAQLQPLILFFGQVNSGVFWLIAGYFYADSSSCRNTNLIKKANTY